MVAVVSVGLYMLAQERFSQRWVRAMLYGRGRYPTPYATVPRLTGLMLRALPTVLLPSASLYLLTAPPPSSLLRRVRRRQSTRDDSSKRSPKGLSARQLLEDAKDVARIREQARLRPAHQGLCWVASNWRVGGKQGVLSGRRCLVLCDSMVWAELKPADRDALGQPIQDADTEERKGGSGRNRILSL